MSKNYQLNPLEHFTDVELIDELHRRSGTNVSDNSGEMCKCSTCGATLYPNQTHFCIQPITTSADFE